MSRMRLSPPLAALVFLGLLTSQAPPAIATHGDDRDVTAGSSTGRGQWATAL
jgi:hypothetical protein